MAPSISRTENSFSLSWNKNLNIFLSIIQWKTGWSKDIFLRKGYVWTTWSFYINPVQWKIHRRWVDNIEVIHCEKAWDSGWRPSFDDSWVIHFCSFMLWNESGHKKYGFVLVLYLFRNISSFESEKGDTAKIPCTSFIYKQKR